MCTISIHDNIILLMMHTFLILLCYKHVALHYQIYAIIFFVSCRAKGPKEETCNSRLCIQYLSQRIIHNLQ